MSETRIFFATCPSRFEHLLSEFLFRVDPARTACEANEAEDEYDALVDTIADHLVDHDGVLTESDWNYMVGDTFGLVKYPFGVENIALFRAFFPNAIVHVNGEIL